MSNFNAELTNRDYEVKIDQYFSRGWEIFKEYPWGFILFTLLYLVIVGLLSVLLPSPLGARPGDGESFGGANIVANILSPILGVGYYCVALQIARRRPKSFSDFFGGFNKFVPVFLTALVSGLLIGLGSVLLVLPGIYLAVSYLFAQLFVVDKNLGFWSAMETSRRLITKKWFSFFGLGLLMFLLILAGLLCFGVGVLVTIPLGSCVLTAAYEDIVGLNSVAGQG
ncbi:MAG: hypothetical protein VKO01_10975 [Cyanobacteriota bacterium]|jgi:uncharacterized membrane protein|nr:hypothetical protein [Cyanobacteriota bacterium]